MKVKGVRQCPHQGSPAWEDAVGTDAQTPVQDVSPQLAVRVSAWPWAVSPALSSTRPPALRILL